MSKHEQGKNNKIEALRFLFCMLIVIMHINKTLWGSEKFLFNSSFITLALHGYIGVEFFFLVSGYLMAKKLNSLDGECFDIQTAGPETLRFLYGKIRPLLPYHFFICCIIFVIWCFLYPAQFFTLFMDRLPGLLFLHRVGLLGKNVKDLIGVEWYICSMLMAMALLYPLGRKLSRTFRCLAPIAGLLVCSYILLNIGKLDDVTGVLGFTFVCNWRALGEIMIGFGCYEAAERIREKPLKPTQRTLLSILETLGYLLIIVYVFSNLPCKYDMIALCILAVSVTLSFAGKGWVASSGLFRWKFWTYLGRLSVTCYLSQVLFVSYLPTIMGDTKLPLNIQALLCFTGTLVFSISTHWVHRFGKKNQKMQQSTSVSDS